MFLQRTVILMVSIIIITTLSLLPAANASMWDTKEDLSICSRVCIPDDEFTAYFDINGIYTVIGAIKNSEDFSVIPTVIIHIQDGEKTVSKSFEYIPVFPSKELPFKIKFPEITSKSPILQKPQITYIRTEKTPLNVEVIYDDTLIQHDDGHLTGRIINNGDSVVYNIKVFAIIHGYEKVLDMGRNIEMIEKMEPGETKTFSMYPDP